MNHHEIAAEMSKALGRTVTYQPIDLDLFKKRLNTDATFGGTLTQHLLSVAVDYQEGIFAGTDSFIEELTGAAPMTVQAFTRKHAALFA